jgi:hypothetical protein
MEAFEQVVRVYLETKGYVVSTNVKFAVRRRTQKEEREESQTHGYEVDLVAAKKGSLILGFVKSYLGSGGVDRQGFQALADKTKKTYFGRYKFFNEPDIREGVLAGATERYGYPLEEIRVAMYAGRFRNGHETDVRNYLESMQVGGGAVEVVGLDKIVFGLWSQTASKTYINDPVLVTMKAMRKLEWKPPQQSENTSNEGA